MAIAHKESIQHQRVVQRLCRNLIRDGCPPGEISISGMQNPDIESWAKKKGIRVSKVQKLDILHPEGYSMEARGKK